MTFLAAIDLTGTETNSLFQDVAGTTAATDRIGKAIDQTGNGNDVIAMNDAGRPKKVDGFALYDDYDNHRLYSPVLSGAGAETYVCVYFEQSSFNILSNHLITRGLDSESGFLAGDQGNGNFRLPSGSGSIISEVTTSSGPHLLEIWAGTPARYSLDGGAITDASEDWTEGLHRLVIGGRGIGFASSNSWMGDIYRVVVKSSAPTDSERVKASRWVQGLDANWNTPVPETDEEIWSANFADALGAPPQTTALIRASDAQKLADHNVGLFLSGPRWYRLPVYVPVGELADFKPLTVRTFRADLPGLQNGKKLLILGREGTARPGVVTLTCWG